MRSALVSLVVLCNALTNRPPGLPGDMASPPGMPTQFVASAPASSGFRLDEICSSNCLRGKTGRFLTSPNHSPMVTMDGAITWNISGTIPDLRPVETTAFIPPFRRSIGHFGHLEPSGAHFGDNNISYPDMWTHPSWCHLSNGPPLYNAKRPPSTTFATAKITYHDTIYWPALRLLEEVALFLTFARDKSFIGGLLVMGWFVCTPSAWLHLAKITIGTAISAFPRVLAASWTCAALPPALALFVGFASLSTAARITHGLTRLVWRLFGFGVRSILYQLQLIGLRVSIFILLWARRALDLPSRDME